MDGGYRSPPNSPAAPPNSPPTQQQQQAIPWHIPQPGPSTPPPVPPASPLRQTFSPTVPPPVVQLNSALIGNLVQPMLALGISNPNRGHFGVQYQAEGIQQGQNAPQILEQNLNIQVNQEGQVSGQNEEVRQVYNIRVRRDLH